MAAKDRLRRILVTSAIAAASLVALEFLSGIGLPKPPGQPILENAPGEKYLYRMRPGLDTAFSGYSAPSRTVRLLTDGRGFRVSPSDVDVNSPYEMYFFGDEFVVGEGLEADETFEVSFERKYRERYKEPYRVHNAGVPGYNLRLATERVMALLKTNKPFDWVLVLRDDDLGPAPSGLERFAWSAPVGLRILERLGRIDAWNSGRESSGHETFESLSPLIAELGKANRTESGTHPCVIAVMTDSELHIRIASEIATVARCQRQDMLKQLSEDADRNLRKGTNLLTAEGAAQFALLMRTGLSASFEYRPVQNAPVDKPAP